MASFREAYRSREIRGAYNGWMHLVLVVCGSLFAIGLALSLVKDPILVDWAFIPFTLLIANIVEYFGHRGPMHKRVPGMDILFRRHALVHHQFFDDQQMSCESSRDHHIVLFPPMMLVFYLGLIALPGSAVVYLFTSLNTACFVFATCVFYYLAYELSHFAYHADPQSHIGRLPFIARLREHHRIHHAHHLMGKYNFNITWPIGDHLFGTVYHPPESATPTDSCESMISDQDTPPAATVRHEKTPEQSVLSTWSEESGVAS